MAWLWILLGLILLALLIWWIVGNNDDVETAAVEPVEVGQVDETATIGAEGPTLAAIATNPASYFGQTFSGEATVGSEITDRGFWLESDGARMFAVIIDQPREEPKDINPGQRLRLTGGQVTDVANLSSIAGDALDDDTRNIANQQQAVIAVDEDNIEILQQG